MPAARDAAAADDDDDYQGSLTTMPGTGTTAHQPAARIRGRYHRDAYEFVTQALRVTQELLGRMPSRSGDENSAHVTGRELLQGIRVLALKQFGMLAPDVFRAWGVHTTVDFGRIVFELVEREEFRRTERDQLSDFVDVYDFDDVFRRDYEIDTSKAFRA